MRLPVLPAILHRTAARSPADVRPLHPSRLLDGGCCGAAGVLGTCWAVGLGGDVVKANRIYKQVDVGIRVPEKKLWWHVTEGKQHGYGPTKCAARKDLEYGVERIKEGR